MSKMQAEMSTSRARIVPPERIAYVSELAEEAELKAEAIKTLDRIATQARESVQRGRAVARALRDYHTAVDASLDEMWEIAVAEVPHDVAARIRQIIALACFVHQHVIAEILPAEQGNGNVFVQVLTRKFQRQLRRLEKFRLGLDKQWSACVVNDFSSRLRVLREQSPASPSQAFLALAQEALDGCAEREREPVDGWAARVSKSAAGGSD